VRNLADRRQFDPARSPTLTLKAEIYGPFVKVLMVSDAPVTFKDDLTSVFKASSCFPLLGRAAGLCQTATTFAEAAQ
jgi:hypothetical protein